MSDTKQPTFVDSVAEFFNHFLHSSPPPPPPAPAPPQLRLVAGELSESLGALSRLAEALNVHCPESEADRKSAEELRREREKRAVELARSNMRAAILEMHRRLATGLDLEGLERLDKGMEELLPFMEDCAGAEITRRIMSCTLHRFYEEVGVIAWERLLQHM
ncbi:MAG: hypothetical protein AB1758_02545, partial [Candidatus Eremiobacterota bacterium]